jgi:hypothetical protein
MRLSGIVSNSFTRLIRNFGEQLFVDFGVGDR